MTVINRHDLVVIRMGIDALLESVRQAEHWCRLRHEGSALRCVQSLHDAIGNTRRKLIVEDAESSVVAAARIVAVGLRDAASQCKEEQAALSARLVTGAEMIEQLCRLAAIRR